MIKWILYYLFNQDTAVRNAVDQGAEPMLNGRMSGCQKCDYCKTVWIYTRGWWGECPNCGAPTKFRMFYWIKHISVEEHNARFS